jgi:hypothetical protein
MVPATVLGLAALALVSVEFFGWSWFEFRDDSGLHPIYKAKQFSFSDAKRGEQPKRGA